MSRLTFLLALANGALAQIPVNMYVENLGSARFGSTLGVYWNGDAEIGRPLTARDYYYERLIDTIPGDSYVQHATFLGHSFTIRSSDFKTRVKVSAVSFKLLWGCGAPRVGFSCAVAGDD